MDTGGVVEDRDGFGVDLLADTEDGGGDVEGGLSAVSVVVERLDAVGVGSEELLIDFYAQL